MAGTFPSEVWADVLFYAAGPGGEREGMTDKERAQLRDVRLAVIQVCRGWKVSWISFCLDSFGIEEPIEARGWVGWQSDLGGKGGKRPVQLLSSRSTNVVSLPS